MASGMNIGSIYAEASLDIEKFKSAAAQMGGETSKIVAALDKAGTSVEKAQLKIDSLSANLEIARDRMSSMGAVVATNEQELARLEEAANAAAMRAGDLEQAYEDASEEFGETSIQAKMASDEFNEAASKADTLNQAVEKQEAKLSKSQAAFKKAQAAVQKYEKQISSTEKSIAEMNGTIEQLNGQLTSAMLPDASADIDTVAASTSDWGISLETVSKKGLRALGSSLSSAVGQMGTFKDATGASGVALTALQRSISPLLSSMSMTTAGLLAVVAAAGYGAYKLYDYASGAKAARDAMEQLNQTAKTWQDTNVTTSFEKSKGLNAYGITADVFTPAVTRSEDWLDTLIKVWTDGKVETDEIVNEMVTGFTSGTDQLRQGMQDLQKTAAQAGVGDIGLFGDLDSDLTRLDEIDAQVDALLNKRQNGFLTDDEITMLQNLIDERGALEIKYHLTEDGTSGFDEITQNVEAQLSREADAGQVMADAYAAASQGLQSYNDALNAEYDAQYKVIDLMKDGEEKTAALQELQDWRNKQAIAGVEAYKETLQDTAKLTGVFDEGGKYAQSMQQITTAAELMNKALENPTDENIAALSTALSELDETQIVELTASLSTMSAAGVEMTDSMTKAETALAAFKQVTENGTFEKVSSDLQSAFSALFGENLDSEVLEINTTLNTEQLNSVYDAWAAGTHADIIPGINITPIDTEISGLSVDIEGHVTVVTSDGKSLDVSEIKLDPITGHVTAVTSDGKTLSMSNVKYDPLTGYVTAIYGDDETTISIDKLQTLEGTITYVEESPNLEKPKIQLEAEIVNFSEGKFSNRTDAPQEYYQGKGLTNSGAGKGFSGSLFQGDFVKSVNEYVAAANKLQTAQQKLNEIDMVSNIQGYMDAQNDVDAANAALSSAGNALLSFSEDGENFEAAVQYVTNGMQMLSEGSLSDEDAQALLSFVSNLQFAMDALGESDIGNDLMEGIAEGMRGYGWDSDASTIASDIETALREATNTHSPSEMTKPIGTDITDGVGEGMKDTSSIDDAAQTVASAAESALLARLTNSYSAGANFSAGLARGILAGRAGVIAAAVSVAKSAADATRKTLDIHSPSGVTEGYGEFFGLGFIKGIENTVPKIDKSIESMFDIEPPRAYRAQNVSYDSRPSPAAPIDYDAMASAMNQRPIYLTQDGRIVAAIGAKDNITAQNSYMRSYALAYGK